VKITESHLRIIIRKELKRRRVFLTEHSTSPSKPQSISEFVSTIKREEIHEQLMMPRAPSLSLALYGHETLGRGFITDTQLLNQYFDRPWTLDEATSLSARLLIEELKAAIHLLREKWLGAIGSAISKGAKVAGSKVADAGKYLTDKAAKATGKLKDSLNWMADKGSDLVMQMLAKIPFAEEIIAWIKEAPGKLATMAKEAGAAMKEWVKNAKKNAMNFVINLISKDPEVKKDILEEFGVSEEEIKALMAESRFLRVETYEDLKWWISIDRETDMLLEKQEEIEKISKGDKAPFTGTIVSPKAAKKIGKGDQGAIGKLSGGQSKGKSLKKTIVTLLKQAATNPEEALKTLATSGKKILVGVMDVVSSLVEKNPEKYMKLMGDSAIMKPFKTGYGYAAGVLGTIMTSPTDDLAVIKKLLVKMKKGWDAGMGDMGQEAINFMLKPSSKGKGIRLSRIIKNIVGGGGNVAQMVKAYAGDPKAAAALTKRVFNMVYREVKKMMAKNSDSIIAKIPGGKELKDDGKKELIIAFDDAIQGMFGAEEVT